MKSNDWNTRVRQGVEVGDSPYQRTISTNSSTATPLSSTPIEIVWVILQNTGTANVYIGASDVAISGANRGIIMRPNGETPALPLDDLSEIYVIAASGTPEVAFLAGLRNT